MFTEPMMPLFAPITVRVEYDDKQKDFTVRWAYGKEYVRDDTDKVWNWIRTNIKGAPYTAKIGYPLYMVKLTQKKARWYFGHEVPFAVDTEGDEGEQRVMRAEHTGQETSSRSNRLECECSLRCQGSLRDLCESRG